MSMVLNGFLTRIKGTKDMRNLQCTITDMRKKVFAEVAKLAYEGGDYYTRLEKLPYELSPAR